MANVIGAVVHKEPDWSRLPDGSSFAVSRLVRRCLQKEARERLHAIADARFELEDISLTLPTVEVDNRTAPRTSRTFVAGFGVAVLLGGLAWSFWPTAKPTAGNNLVPRRLTSNPVENSVTGAALSADGRYLAYVDNNGLFVRLIESGETTRVEMPGGFALGEVDWYPDGTSLLFTAITEDKQALWRISVLGGEPRLVADGARRASVSPDGSRIAYLLRAPSSAVYVAGPNGEAPKQLVAATSVWELAWSPDAAWLLYGNFPFDVERTTIEAIRVDGSGHKIVLSGAALFQNWMGALPFYWAPDDRLIYAMREAVPTEDSSNLWAVDIDRSTAQVMSEPSRITHLSGHNIQDVFVTADGASLSFRVERSQEDVYVSELDASGAALVKTRRLTLDDRNDQPNGWMADSRTVLFTSDRTGSRDPYRQQVDEVVPVGLYASPVNAHDPHLSADGEWILFWSGEDLLRVPTGGGPPALILTKTGWVQSYDQTKCAPARRCVIGERDGTSQEYVFFHLDPVEGKGDELARIEDRPPFIGWALSPDGERIAIVNMNYSLRVLELDTGDVLELGDDEWGFGEFVAWDVHGNGVYMDATPAPIAGGRAFRRSQLVYVRLGADLEVHVLRTGKAQWHVRPNLSPDGRYLAYGVVTFSGNAWMIEGF